MLGPFSTMTDTEVMKFVKDSIPAEFDSKKHTYLNEEGKLEWYTHNGHTLPVTNKKADLGFFYDKGQFMHARHEAL